MATHLIDSFRGGISSDNRRGIPGAYKQGAALSVRRVDDSLTTGKKMVKESGSTVTDLIQQVVVGSLGTTYMFGDAGKIYQRTSTGTWSYICTDADGAASGAAEWHGYIYWAVGAKLKRTPVGTTNFPAPTTISESMDANYPHFMKAISGWLVIADGSKVAGVDYNPTITIKGTTVNLSTTVTVVSPPTLNTDWLRVGMSISGTNIPNGTTITAINSDGTTFVISQAATGGASSIFTCQTADLFYSDLCPITPDCYITCLDDRDGFVMAGAQRYDTIAESYIFLIDPDRFTDAEAHYTKRFRIASKGLNAMITNEGAYAHANGKIYYTDFVTVASVKRIEGSLIKPAAVSVKESLCLFGLYGNTIPGIYSFGREDINQNQCLTCEYILSPDQAQIADGSWTTTVSDIGAIWTQGDLVFCSWKSGQATYGVDVIDTANKSNGFYESLELRFQPLKEKVMVIENVKIQMAPLPSGCSIAVMYKVDKGSWQDAYLFDTATTSFAVTGATEAWFAIQAQAKLCYEIRVELNASTTYAPEIYDIESYITNPAA